MDWIRFRNSYLQTPWLFSKVIGDRQFDATLEDRPRTFWGVIQRALEKALWFWPRVIDASLWVRGAEGKLQNPLSFKDIDNDARLLLGWVERVCPDKNATILDIGCNCGRHLIELSHRGYKNLVGVDVMKAALDLFAERSPDVFKATEIHFDLFQRFLMKQPDRRFDLTYSHGATIELVHPSFDVVAHLCRVTKTHICLLLNCNNGFPRNWVRKFTNQGFVLLHSEEPIPGDKELCLFVFQRALAAS